MPLSAETVSPVAPEVWRITTPLPFRPRTVHAFLVGLPGARWLLVDGGIGTAEAWAVLDAAVRAVAGGWGGVALHLVTHMHLDHLGLAERVREASGAPLAMGRLDAERAAHAAAHPDEEAEYRDRLLREHGAPPEQIVALQSGRPRGEPLSAFVPPVPLPDGDRVPLPDAPGWDVVWTPGHTAGHVSLFRPDDRLLLAGDAVLPHVTPTIGVNRQRADPVADYLRSLDRLLQLECRLALGGHGEPIEDPARRIRELREATCAETERVAARLAATPRSAWSVALALYAGRDLPPAARMLAFRETLAHLQHLEAARRARRTPGRSVRFSLI